MNDTMCPQDGATMTSLRRSGVPMRICPTCEATLLPAGGLDQILASERQAAGPPAYQDYPDQRGDYRGGKHGGRRGGWGGMFGGGHH